MQQSDLLEAIKELAANIEADPSLTEDVKGSVLDVVIQTFNDPTPENFEALSVLMQQLSKLHRFANAVNLITGATD